MELEKQIKELFGRKLAGTPWVLGVTTGEITSPDEVATEELVRGLTIQLGAVMEAVTLLAREMDARE